MPSLIPLLLAHHDLPAPVLASLKIVADARDPHAPARARQVASAGLRAAYDLSEAEVADLIDPGQASAASGGMADRPARGAPAPPARAPRTRSSAVRPRGAVPAGAPTAGAAAPATAPARGARRPGRRRPRAPPPRNATSADVSDGGSWPASAACRWRPRDPEQRLPVRRLGTAGGRGPAPLLRQLAPLRHVQTQAAGPAPRGPAPAASRCDRCRHPARPRSPPPAAPAPARCPPGTRPRPPPCPRVRRTARSRESRGRSPPPPRRRARAAAPAPPPAGAGTGPDPPGRAPAAAGAGGDRRAPGSAGRTSGRSRRRRGRSAITGATASCRTASWPCSAPYRRKLVHWLAGRSAGGGTRPAPGDGLDGGGARFPLGARGAGPRPATTTSSRRPPASTGRASGGHTSWARWPAKRASSAAGAAGVEIDQQQLVAVANLELGRDPLLPAPAGQRARPAAIGGVGDAPAGGRDHETGQRQARQERQVRPAAPSRAPRDGAGGQTTSPAAAGTAPAARWSTAPGAAPPGPPPGPGAAGPAVRPRRDPPPAAGRPG